MLDQENEKERWTKPDHLSIEGILNYWFGQDKDLRLNQKESLKMACLQGQIECVQNCDEEINASVADLFDADKILINRISFEKWISGEESDVIDPGTPEHWFDDVLVKGDVLREKAAEQEKAEEEQLLNEQRTKEQQKIKERARLETETRLETEQEFTKKSKKKNQETGPIGRRMFNSYVNLVGAMYETFVDKVHGESLPDSLEELIVHFEIHYNDVDGLSRRTLAGRFNDAVRELNSNKD